MKKYLSWLVAAFIITVIFVTIFACVQQSLRLGANDPQIQIAQDTAESIDSGVLIKDAVTGQVNLNKSLSPAVIVYDRTGKAVGGSANLDGEVPTIPVGVLKNSDGKKYNAVTWQPDPDHRFASVTVAADAFYVTAVRSLSEVENRIAKIGTIALTCWLVSLLALVVAFVIKTYKPVKKQADIKLKK